MLEHTARPIERPPELIVPTSVAVTVTLVVPDKAELDEVVPDEDEELDDDFVVKPTDRPIIRPIAAKHTITEAIILRPNKLNLLVNT